MTLPGCYPCSMNEKQIWKMLGLVGGVGFLSGAGSIVAVANILGWW